MTLLITTVLIGALIGFGTNLLAIGMLFRPWTEKRFLGMRVPFTPGMVPKRQAEIAAKLGGVVEDHLLTESGIIAALNRPEWMAEVQEAIVTGIENQLVINRTPRSLLQELTGLTYDEMSRRAEKWTSNLYAAQILPRLNERRIGDLVPAGSEVWVQEQTRVLADKLLEIAAEWAESSEVRLHLSNSINERLMAGGVLGKMAVMFVQEERLVDELLPYMQKWLRSPATSLIVQTKLADLWETVLNRNAGETLDRFLTASTTETDGVPFFLKDLGERLLDMDLYASWTANRVQLEAAINKWLIRIQQSAPKWIAPIMKSVGISRIVEQEVASFPIPKLEKLVVDVVKKELAMITWLGALLGGLIGVIQALLVIGWK